MKKRVLVAYSTKYGSTTEVAQKISEVLNESGFASEVKNVKEVSDVGSYDAIIVGSAIYVGKVLPESLNFVTKHKTSLSKVPMAYFVVSGRYGDNPTKNFTEADGSMNPFRELVKPIDTTVTGGKIDYAALNFFERIMCRLLGAKESDHRNWTEIEKWAKGLSGKI
ncbi:MAG: hypothetical protein DKM50_13855 [Candidatus Margulisiibacteriota bacterium]|nr:MAG: hypothetical protein A2X43_09030 [Candidatus Margulisbacteria bacterium GWD2_39_127]OGI03567.1 MAG: hypothetical protein A2X42_00870 [Candidatus Margulisbacteria bacterium GWF2_38_17]OGI11072.1 MAG: hypothetical protein A2X41_02165 [Candidatus Margulisbacteria bacterium GWE2_39_32]PZM77071.1 MAG: hypothetical protein DKM50_13855 [Candidatus Margulisiibacteriota bacterium]HAR62332.1 hypothetical protein [Candidatus Margulisiibacteriota bacterium]